MTDDLLMSHLRGLDAPRLAALLRLRPDAVVPPVPGGLWQLAERLRTPGSTEAALRTLPAPALDLLQMLQYLGPRADRTRLRELVLREGPADEAAFERTLDALLDRALLFDTGGALELIPPLRTAFANPLGHGRPVAELLAAVPASWATHILGSLQVQRPRDAAAARAAVAQALDPDRVRQLLQVGPPDARACLEQLVREGSVADPGGYIAAHMGPGTWRPPSRYDYLLDHGLAVLTPEGRIVPTRELLDVLLEPPRDLPVALHQPPVATVPADEVPVQRESSAAATSALALVTELLEELAARPAPTLRTGLGGLGVREVRRLAKVLGCSEDSFTLAARLADLAGLARAMDEVRVTPAYPAWREQDPPERLVALLTAWWLEPRAVTAEMEPGQRKPFPLFVRGGADPSLRSLRQAVLRALADLPPGRGMLDVPSLIAHVRWAAPMAVPPNVGDLLTRHVDAALAEMRALGLVAHGRASALGVALAGDDLDALRAEAAAALPDVADDVLLQADLTAVVTGSPSAALTSLLDAMADREARGNASTWRFGTGSVRRALDAGLAADDLLERLTAVARGDVPQPLTYLVRDVARRHGHLAVAPVTCVVVADDPALLAEVVAHRGLRALAPRLLAPTVLASSRSVADTLRALREAGYLPVEHDAGGQVVLAGRAPAAAAPKTRRGTQPPAKRPAPSTALDVDALAAALLAAPEKAPAAKKPAKGRSATSGKGGAAPTRADDALFVLTYCGHLSDDEVALLVEAERTGGEIVIEYVDQRGRWTERVVSDCVLDPPYLEAWCHLRDDEREFLLQSIQTVRRVS
ncbi:MAG TPA: helicase-associated domain-containing protein [Motilibacteraceae bacterium]|nr:helicase-associated domain-containing protein [Motilibacteraceae bacterium]